MIARVRLHETTPADIRAALGDPDEQASDGSFLYRFTAPHGHGTARRIEDETVRFRFEAGTLSKICRTRS